MSDIPAYGDRSAWDVTHYPHVHASDLASGTAIHHLPENPTLDDTVKWNGSKWIPVPYAEIKESFITLRHGSTLTQFPATDVGWDAATASAVSGDEITIPPCTSGNYQYHNLGEGVNYVGTAQASVIVEVGIKFAFGASLSNMTIEVSANSGATINGIESPAGSGSDSMSITDVICTVRQSGSGGARAIYLTTGVWYIVNCSFTATTIIGSGYAAYLSPGGDATPLFFNTFLAGTTAAINTYDQVDGLPVIENLVPILATYDGVTGSVTSMQKKIHNSSGTPVAGFGMREYYLMETSTTPSVEAMYEDITWTNPTHNSQSSKYALYNASSGTVASHFQIDGPEVKMGDIAGGNYTRVCSDGTLEFVGNATVFEDENFEGLSLGVGASAPDLITFFGSGSIQGYGFDGGAILEQLFGGNEVLHSYKQGSDIVFHVHWMPVNTNAGSVKWNLEYSWSNQDGVFPTPTTISVTQAASGTAWKHQVAIFPTISGTGKTIESHFMFRLYRDPSDVSDTYGSDAALISVGVHIEKDTVGSRTTNSK